MVRKDMVRKDMVRKDMVRKDMHRGPNDDDIIDRIRRLRPRRRL